MHHVCTCFRRGHLVPYAIALLIPLSSLSLNLEPGRRSNHTTALLSLLPQHCGYSPLWPHPVIWYVLKSILTIHQTKCPLLFEMVEHWLPKWSGGGEQFTVNGMLMSNWSHWDIPMSTYREKLQGFLPLLRGQSKKTPCSLSLRWCLPFIPHCPNSLGLWADGIFQTCVEG